MCRSTHGRSATAADRQTASAASGFDWRCSEPADRAACCPKRTWEGNTVEGTSWNSHTRANSHAAIAAHARALRRPRRNRRDGLRSTHDVHWRVAADGASRSKENEGKTTCMFCLKPALHLTCAALRGPGDRRHPAPKTTRCHQRTAPANGFGPQPLPRSAWRTAT
jgi:hypothetical protein